MNKYATIEDYLQLYNAEIDDNKKERLIMLLDLASSLLREEARERGHNLDRMIERNPDKANVAKLVVLSSVRRVMSKEEEDSLNLQQFSQSAMGYTISGTYFNPGDDLYFLKNELSRLGLNKQKVTSISLI